MQEPIKILGVLPEEMGTPRSDGTRGSALYDVPLRLSRKPSMVWTQLFEEKWVNPPCPFTAHHFAVRCRVDGDRIILHRTTIEDVDKVHRPVLKAVLDVVNVLAPQQEAQESREQQLRQEKANKERNARIARAKEVKF